MEKEPKIEKYLIPPRKWYMSEGRKSSGTIISGILYDNPDSNVQVGDLHIITQGVCAENDKYLYQ